MLSVLFHWPNTHQPGCSPFFSVCVWRSGFQLYPNSLGAFISPTGYVLRHTSCCLQTLYSELTPGLLFLDSPLPSPSLQILPKSVNALLWITPSNGSAPVSTYTAGSAVVSGRDRTCFRNVLKGLSSLSIRVFLGNTTSHEQEEHMFVLAASMSLGPTHSRHAVQPPWDHILFYGSSWCSLWQPSPDLMIPICMFSSTTCRGSPVIVTGSSVVAACLASSKTSTMTLFTDCKR